MKNALLILLLGLGTLLHAQEPKFGKVSKKLLLETAHPIDSTADAAYLYKKRRVYFEYDSNDGFVLVNEYHNRIKIYNKEGFSYANKNIPYYKPESGDTDKVYGLKGYTFTLEKGKVVKQKLSSKDIFDEKVNKVYSQKKIAFPNVKEGAIIDIKYKIISPYWSIETLNFQYDIPVNKLNYKVEIPEYFVFNQRVKGYYRIPVQQEKISKSIVLRSKSRSGYATVSTSYSSQNKTYQVTSYVYDKDNVPAMKDNEPYSGNINNYRGGIEFELSGTRFPNTMYRNYSNSWESVSKKIALSPNFGEQLKKKRYFKEDLAVLLKDAQSIQEKVSLIFNFVKNKVKWNEYRGFYADQGVKKAYKEGTGNVADINLMLTSMLRSQEIQANPVLISTRANGIPIFPTRKGFNYVICKVNFPDETFILLDATDRYSTANILPQRCLNWNGREILDNGASQWVALTPNKYANETNNLYLKIDEDLAVTGMLRSTYSNHIAMGYRQKNNLKKEEDIIANLEEEYSIEIDNFKISNQDNLSKNITENFKFETDNFLEELNGKLYFNPSYFLAEKENIFKSKERKYPVDFVMPQEYKNTVSIKIPNGYTIESIPESLGIGLPENYGVFKFQIKHANNNIKLVSILQINTNIISPEHYKDLKEFYSKMISKQLEKVVLVKS